MKTLELPSEQRFLFDEADWAFYGSVLEGVGDRHIFVTYDRGRLEIMSPSRRHEGFGRLLGDLIMVVAEELGIPIALGGSTTFRREDLERGLEPDNCYWIQNEARMRAIRDVDLSNDPPPDLAIEVEISARLLDRVAIYAALGVPELWRFDGERLAFSRLSAAGGYEECDRSLSLPQVPRAELERFLAMAGTIDHTTLVRSFRAWVRAHASQAQ